MARIIVLAGGTSPERDVSLRSGAAVNQALLSSGYDSTVLDTTDGLETLLPQLHSVAVIFPALHGEGGEDGSLQKFLETHDIAFVGSGSAASELCYDKNRYTELLIEHGIQVPATALVDYEAFSNSELVNAPFVLKPNDGGSSIDTFIVRDPAAQDVETIKTAFDTHGHLLLQELIEGAEITIAVLSDESLPVIEIIPPADQEFDYENKYNGATQELCPPLHVSAELQKQAQVIALEIHELTGCRDMSRTDIMIDGSGKLVVLETNTIPGLTDQSLLPKAAAAAGYSMPDLCGKLVSAALGRQETAGA